MINFKTISAIAVAAAVVAIVPIDNAQAAVITGVTASTNMGAFSYYGIENTVNGYGLTNNLPSLTAAHAGNGYYDSWISSQGKTTGNIDFNLNGQYSLQGFSFWKLSTWCVPGHGYSIKDVEISTSTDGTTYKPLIGAPTQFSQGTDDATVYPEQFKVAPTIANHVRFKVLNTYVSEENSFAAFSEVQFDGTPYTAPPTAVPTPALLPGLIGLGVAALRKRKAEEADEA